MKLGISKFEAGGRTIKFKTPLLLEPTTGPSVGNICVVHADLSLTACDSTLLGCDRIIREELEMLWEEYALAPDNELTKDAIRLKNKLLEMVVDTPKTFEIKKQISIGDIEKMQKHKFRAWDKKQEQWIGVNLHMAVTDGTLWWQLGYGCEPLSAEETENIELAPYIGITDKNDNEIYLGDIVKIKRDGFFEYVSDVRFLHGSYCVTQFGTYFPIFSLARPGDTIEIVGNVFENPKLMGRERNDI